jgi:hypothetical protein
MTVIDVDTHWESTQFAPGEHPLEPWLDQVPPQDVEWLAHAIAGGEPVQRLPGRPARR